MCIEDLSSSHRVDTKGAADFHNVRCLLGGGMPGKYVSTRHIAVLEYSFNANSTTGAALQRQNGLYCSKSVIG